MDGLMCSGTRVDLPLLKFGFVRSAMANLSNMFIVSTLPVRDRHIGVRTPSRAAIRFKCKFRSRITE